LQVGVISSLERLYMDTVLPASLPRGWQGRIP
jgi:hypothetical protein